MKVYIYIFIYTLVNASGKKKEDEFCLFVAGDQIKNMPANNLNEVTFEELPLYSYETLAIGTNNFDSANKLGRGGFGQVYKVNIQVLEGFACCLLLAASCCIQLLQLGHAIVVYTGNVGIWPRNCSEKAVKIFRPRD